jgi:hypothetical protein
MIARKFPDFPHGHACVDRFKLCNYFYLVNGKFWCDLKKQWVVDIHTQHGPCKETTIGVFERPIIL